MYIKIFLLTVAVICILISCKKSDKEITQPHKTSQLGALHLCTPPPLADSLLKVFSSKTESSALLASTKWTTGETITIKFLNGDQFLQNKVKLYVGEWIDYANLKIKYVGANETADIRIGFQWNGDGGSWSYMGKNCRYISQRRVTMNFGWFSSTTPEIEFRRIVLHEFGHALGLIHEHQSPYANIQWNKPVVYNYYNETEGWDSAKVNYNLFNAYYQNSVITTGINTKYGNFDRLSIMMYEFPATLTLNGFYTPNNTDLTIYDQNLVGEVYKYPVTYRNKSFISYAGIVTAITAGQSLIAASENCKLTLLSDGNLVLYNNNAPVWSSNTAGSGAVRLFAKPNNGNYYNGQISNGGIVLVDKNNKVIWGIEPPMSKSDSCIQLKLRNDGNLVAYRISKNADPSSERTEPGNTIVWNAGIY